MVVTADVTPLPGASVSQAERLRPLARLASAGWLAPWAADGGQPGDYLLDLACARECAQADAVGFGSGEYEFTRWLDEPALVRASLLAAGGRRRETGAATDCGCSPSRPAGRAASSPVRATKNFHEIEGQGASGIGRIQTKRAGLR